MCFLTVLYIPLWYDSNILIIGWHHHKMIFTFHSGTILILLRNQPSQHLLALYIPLWYDSNQHFSKPLVRVSRLYIPLWYDSNDKSKPMSSFLMTFTFHSGTILMNAAAMKKRLIQSFTFHSGTILISVRSRRLC